MKKIIAILMALVMLLSLAACGAKEAETPAEKEETPAESANEHSEEVAEPTGKDPSEITLAAILGATDEYYMMLESGIKAACDHYGAKYVSTVGGDTVAIDTAVNTYRAQQIDGLISSFSPDNLDLFRTASEDGILIGSINKVEGNDFSAVSVGYSEYSLGEGAAEYAIKLVEELGGAKVHLIHIWQGSACDDRSFGFVETIQAALGEDSVEVVSESSTLETQTAMQQTRDALTANPDINIIFTESQVMQEGAYSAIEQMGLQGQVYVFSVDANEKMCEEILNEDDVILQGCSAQNAYECGYMVAEQLIQILTGEITDWVPGEHQWLESAALNKGDLEATQAYLELLQSLK